MKTQKIVGMFMSLFLLFTVFGSAYSSVVYANETVSPVAEKSNDVSTSDIMSNLVANEYLTLDPVNKKVSITEKYKQEVLNSVDTRYFNVVFTDNSITVKPKFASRAKDGVNKIVYTWKGFDIYLDNIHSNKVSGLLTIAAGLIGTAAAVAAFAGLLPATVVLGIIANLATLGAGIITYNNHGKGVIIACVGPFPNGIPHWVSSQ